MSFLLFSPTVQDIDLLIESEIEREMDAEMSGADGDDLKALNYKFVGMILVEMTLVVVVPYNDN